ncbi:MAG: type ISP restriction/modification enzyme [Longimicrobiaceae bacterium]
MEAKGISADVRQVVGTEQVARYLEYYGQVLVTSYRDWLLVERGPDGRPVQSERFRMAITEAEFWTKAADPRKTAEELGDRLLEYLQRVMLRRTQISDPETLARLLAAYARDALFRVERGGDLPALAAVREALEEALGVTFRGEHGEHFFRSTLVQTLFYGIFSAWTLWSRNPDGERFDWRTAAWHLRMPVIGALFTQIATRDRLGPLGLVEVLDWAGDALNRVVRNEFFARFEEQRAVQYFYEPFLEAFDPELRKALGVWYTPPEVVKYMVARVDTVLREELGVTDGLADPQVLVLDPCCGTGAYLVEVLDKIAETLQARGEDALLGQELKRAAAERVLGFEILPAPFVVAHLQLGLLLGRYGVDTAVDGGRRVGVYLTNALTGWEPPDEQKHLAFPELEAERDAADQVKRDARILVVIGNPPYNGYPGVAIGEERNLVTTYRETRRAPKPQGQGLNDLYVRFFRIAERRIVEMTGRGVVCFISNYSWLDGLSHTGMRERYLDVFDKISVDALNGDKFRTGKLTPDGESDPSVFSTELNREGIQVGTAVSLLVRTGPNGGTEAVEFTNYWGKDKREKLLASLTGDGLPESEILIPAPELGFPFMPREFGTSYLDWPRVPDLFPESFSGVQTRRDELVIDPIKEVLEERMRTYFNGAVSLGEIGRLVPRAVEKTTQFDPAAVRDFLVRRGFLPQYVVRYCYRPFDIRWLYWEPAPGLLGRRVPELFNEVFQGNRFIVMTGRTRKPQIEPALVTERLTDLNSLDSGARCTPLYLRRHSPDLFANSDHEGTRPNLSEGASDYLEQIGAGEEDLFFHTAAVLHSPAYRAENSGALRQDWPRVPLPSDRVHLSASAALGRQISTLLDPEQGTDSVTAGVVRSELRVIGGAAKVGGGQLSENGIGLTAGWGKRDDRGAVMPGRGRTAPRPYTDDERAAIEAGAIEQSLDPAEAITLLGETCLDVYLNEGAYWRCVPLGVWEYTLGGYQVIKKWLSYREQPLLGRPLTVEEVREVTGMVRRIAAILLLEPALDGAYAAVKGATYPWQGTAAEEEAPRAEEATAIPPAQPRSPTHDSPGPTLL